MFRLFPVFLSLLALVTSVHALTLTSEVLVSSRPPDVNGHAQLRIFQIPTCARDGGCLWQLAIRAEQTGRPDTPYIELRLGKRQGEVGMPEGIKLWLVTRDADGHREIGPTILRIPLDDDGGLRFLGLNIAHLGSAEQVRLQVRGNGDVTLLNRVITLPGIGDEPVFIKRWILSQNLDSIEEFDALHIQVVLPPFTKIRRILNPTPPQLACVLYPVDEPGETTQPFLVFFKDDCDPLN